MPLYRLRERSNT